MGEGFPEDIETVSFIPGVEFEVPVRENWLLKPFADFGVAADVAGDTHAYVYSVGTKSYCTFRRDRKPELTLGNRLHWVGSHTAEVRSDALGLFETALDARFPLRWTIGDRQTNVSIYAVNYLYLDDIEFVRPDDTQVTIDTEWEVGITFGTDPKMRWWKFAAPRFGISYRFGGELNAVRITVGTPF